MLLDPAPDPGELNQRVADVDPNPKLLLVWMLLGPTVPDVFYRNRGRFPTQELGECVELSFSQLQISKKIK